MSIGGLIASILAALLGLWRGKTREQEMTDDKVKALESQAKVLARPDTDFDDAVDRLP